MRRFREATHVFWSGWAEVFDYFSAVRQHGWEILWGAGVIGLVFGIATLRWSPSWYALGYVIAFVVFVCGYQLWRDYHIQLKPQLRVIRVVPQPWHDGLKTMYPKTLMPPPRGVNRHESIAYYFEVAGTSTCLTVRDVRVQLAEINPPVKNLEWLPVLLFHKHDHPPHKEKFDLHPGEVKHVDLVSSFNGDDHFQVRHIVDGANSDVPSAGHHRLTVAITACNTPKVTVLFDVYMDANGVLQCNML